MRLRSLFYGYKSGLILSFMILTVLFSVRLNAGEADNKNETPFYVVERAKAYNLEVRGKRKEALDIYINLSEGNYSKFQISDALTQAVICALSLKKYDKADEFAAKIPLEKYSRLAEMRVMRYQGKNKELTEKFGNEDFDKWPESMRADLYYMRGKGYSALKNDDKALADYLQAAEYEADPKRKSGMYLSLGNLYKDQFNDEDKAIEYYKKISSLGRVDLSYAYSSTLTVANLLRKQKKYDEALKELAKYNISSGYYLLKWLSLKADILLDQGKIKEALAKYKEILANNSIEESHKKDLRLMVERLEMEAKRMGTDK